MLTKDDKKYIDKSFENKIQKAFKVNNEILVKEMVGLFNATNSRIEKVNSNLSEKIDKVDEKLSNRIDKVLSELKDHNNIIDTHERRIEKIEEKVFSTTISS